MFEKILSAFSSKQLHLKNQAESEAIVLLVTLLYRIDKKIKISEQDFLENLLSSLSWSSNIHIETFQVDAIRKVDNALKNNQVKQLIIEACASISSKSELVKILDDLARADGNLDLQEQEIIGLVKSALAQ